MTKSLRDKKLTGIYALYFLMIFNYLATKIAIKELEMINRLKKDASQFKKRPVKGYLN